MAVVNAPYYEDVRWPGSGGLRVPQEKAPASLAVYKELDLGSATSATLTPQQAGASLTTANPTGAVTFLFPGLEPGRIIGVQNLATSSTATLTIGAVGAGSASAVISSSTSAVIAHSTVSNGIIVI